jgi:hypothetical protein
MSPELIGVIIGGAVGLLAGIIPQIIDQTRKRNSVKKIIKAEVTAIIEKALRFLEGKSTPEELRASAPLWSAALASDLVHKKGALAVAARRAVTLDMEMRQSGREEKARQCVEASDKALQLIGKG